MPIRNVVTRGIGTEPGTIRFIPTHGFSFNPERDKEIDNMQKTAERKYEDEVSRGNIDGFNNHTVIGLNIDIDSTTEDLWEFGGERSYPDDNGAAQIFVSSSNAGDTQSIELEVLTADSNGDWNEETVTATLVGQTQTELATTSGDPIVRIHVVMNKGATNFAGDVYVYEGDIVSAGVPQTQSKVRAKVIAGNNRSLMAFRSTPSNNRGIIKTLVGSLIDVSGSAVADIRILVREYGGVFNLKGHLGGLNTGGDSIFSRDYSKNPIIVPPRSDIKLQGVSNTDDTTLTGEFDLEVVENIVAITSEIEYLVDDQFLIDVTAGSVPGTSASPGPGERIGTDTDSKMSISEDALNLDSHSTPAAGDPGNLYDTIIRLAGRLMIVNISVDTGARLALGFDTNQSGDFGENHFRFNPGSILTVRIGGANIAVGAYSTATIYTVVIILRSSGAEYFIKGGMFINWTLLSEDEIDNTSLLNPGIGSGINALTSTNRFLRVPLSRILFPPYLSDGFNNESKDSDGLAHSEGVSGGIGSGGVIIDAWTGGTWGNSGGKASNTPPMGSELITNGDMELDSNWSNSGTPITNEQSAVQQNGGSFSRHYVTDAANEGIISDAFTTSTGVWYRAEFFHYLDDGAAVKMVVRKGDNSGNSLSISKIGSLDTWEPYIQIYRELGGGSAAKLTARGGAAADNHYIDDATVKALPLGSLVKTHDSNLINLKLRIVIDTLASGAQAGGAIRLNVGNPTDPISGLYFYMNGTNFIVDELVSGFYANLLTVAQAFTTGDELELEANGANIRAYHFDAAGNATLIGATITNVLTGTIVGPFSTDSRNLIESCWVKPRGDGAYSQLDNFLP